jgi:DNA-directed RNA polymerase subunit omega
VDPSVLEKLIEKSGGRYKLTVLIQKRIRELMRNAPKLVDIDSDNPMQIAIEEIRQGKIELVNEDEYFEHIRKTGGDDAMLEEKGLTIKGKPK